MSNTPAEIKDHLPFINLATGRVLVFGLGLGMVVGALLQKEGINHITVVELEQDVIDLVGSYYQSISNKVTIKRADAFAYDDEQFYDYVWFDIWDNITSDNLSEMQILKKRWSYRSGVCMCWREDDCLRTSASRKPPGYLVVKGLYLN